MAKRKSSNPSWSDVRHTIENLEQNKIVKLVADLYRFSNENQSFLHARFGIGNDPLAPYKKTIEECMYPDVYTDEPIQISKAKSAISAYSDATGDPYGEAELMIFFVECGTRFTVDFGDMYDDFYDALNRMYQKAIDRVLSLPEERQSSFRERLKQIMISSSGIGWGYHDILSDDYYNAFSD
jgi:hypothetical protein